ncbi:hypothetical protein MUU77_11805 [Pseudoxanthomonas sp. F37]|uniref:DUF6624 domain-containing protein n=1 Tax=Pseudoxanthomonas TaxID=83618 RepID=UPI001FD2D168|nr:MULTISPECIES: DUF6624 domain-containing protein [Pseudoxanthomonas]UOV05950.1 hypothetical protein MUU75_04450 [Pseudoxanthomonas mexicana]UOV07548.1 hypothetical protein MUU77_11805 [Pseudoxanthomonas sp. F37]
MSMFGRSVQIFFSIGLLLFCSAAFGASEDYRVSKAKSHDEAEASAYAELLKEDRPLSSESIEKFKLALRTYGWPTVASVGLDTVDAIGRLLLDAGLDPLFQEDVLRAMDPQVSVDIDPYAYARLVDEIQIKNRESQRYGTVIHQDVDGKAIVPSMPKSLSGLRFYRDFYGLEDASSQLQRVQRRLDEGLSLDEANPFPRLSVEFAGYQLAELRQELGRMIESDQRTRHALIGAKTDAEKEQLRAAVERADADNLSRLHEILEQHGFPGVAQVGRDGVSTFFLLVQHASDVELQRRALDLAKPLMETRQLSRQQFALLTDRVLLAEGKKQLYGTQTDRVDGKIVLKPVEDIAHLDARRMQMAMGPSEEYLDLIRARYQDK